MRVASFDAVGVGSRRRPESPKSSRWSPRTRGLGSHASATSRPLIRVLKLRKEELLPDDGAKHRKLVHGALVIGSRILPGFVIWGGTVGLVVCALCRFRWGILLSLTLYTCYMMHLGASFMLFSISGLFKVWVCQRENWYNMYCNYAEKLERSEERASLTMVGDGSGEISWHDVIHVVILPNYKTPLDVLEGTLRALTQFSLAKTNLGVCLAFELREDGAQKKAQALREKFGTKFLFIYDTYHPPDVAGHVPGKSSNECWAFLRLREYLLQCQDISEYDPRVLITVIDDDSEVHENYFEALNYHFLVANDKERYLTTWQPPICHFKNYLRQPMLIRLSAVYATLHELACLANPIDCHVLYSSYSMSLMLASCVGGWDPQYLAEDWHMFAKCSLMTSGRVRCKPIFLPLMNYTPEEETYCGTLHSRWIQAKRHALGVAEISYVIPSVYLGLLESGSWKNALVYLWRLSPLLGKFCSVHFANGMSVIWNVLAQLAIHFYMWRSWCYISEVNDVTGTCQMAIAAATLHGIAEETIIHNSWMVYAQQRVAAVMAVSSFLVGGAGAIYFQIVRDRVDGDVAGNCWYSVPLLHWCHLEVMIALLGLFQSFIFGTVPLWIACMRILCETSFAHEVAGMVGRKSEAEQGRAL